MSSSPLDIQTPLDGFEIKDLLSKHNSRQVLWHKLRVAIPSLESVPILNSEIIKSANLSSKQQMWLETLTSGGKTLNEIASSLAQDSLEVTNIFANLLAKKFVKLKSTTITTSVEIFVVDDSPLI